MEIRDGDNPVSCVVLAEFSFLSFYDIILVRTMVSPMPGEVQMPITGEQMVVAVSEDERSELRLLDELLTQGDLRTPLIGSSGEQVELPDAALNALRLIVHHLAQGQAVTLIPADTLLSTQQAADILHISRPSLVALLERGELPFERTGVHRRIRSNDVLAYKRNRYIQRKRALDEVDALVQAVGEYT